MRLEIVNLHILLNIVKVNGNVDNLENMLETTVAQKVHKEIQGNSENSTS